MINEQVEYEKCKNDFLYFINTYIYIDDYIDGSKRFKLDADNAGLVNNFLHNRCSITLGPRQTGKTTLPLLYLLHQFLFTKDNSLTCVNRNIRNAKSVKNDFMRLYSLLPDFIRLENSKDINTIDKLYSCISNNKITFTIQSQLIGCNVNVIFFNGLHYRTKEDYINLRRNAEVFSTTGTKVIITGLASHLGVPEVKDIYYSKIFSSQMITYKNYRKFWGRFKEEKEKLIGTDNFSNEYDFNVAMIT